MKNTFFTITHPLLFVSIVLVFGIVSCQKNSKNEKQVFFYFDITQYFDKEAKRLAANNFEVIKTVSLNNKAETKTLKIENWESEFHVFQESDINKTAFIGKYLIDTTFIQPDTFKVHYQALDKKLKTQTIELTFAKQDSFPHAVKIEIQSNNMLFQSQQFLTYQKNKFYEILAIQQVKFYGTDSVTIYTHFI